MASSSEVARVRDAFDQAKRAMKLVEDGRVLKQDMYMVDGLEKLKRAFRELEYAVDELK